MTTQSAYKSSKASENALAVYNKLLNDWPVSYETRFIQTSFGETHIIISGNPEGLPLILLHGGGGNSTMWIFNVAGLSEKFRVFAVDIIGEAGKSAGTRPSYQSDDHARWLKEVLDGLNIQRAAICGASLGGTFAHQFAIKYPQSVSSLVLLAPPSLFKMNYTFIFRAILANMFPSDFFARKFLKYISAGASNLPEWAIQSFVTQFQSYKPNYEVIPLITDKELTQLPTKTLILIGEDEVLYDAKRVASKIHSVAPLIKIEIIPGAKHILSSDRPEVINKKLIEFLC